MHEKFDKSQHFPKNSVLNYKGGGKIFNMGP